MKENEDNKKRYGYDLWAALDAIKKKDFDYPSRLEDDERKKLLENLFVVQRWLSNPTNVSKEKYYNNLVILNQVVNRNFLSLYRDQNLGENHRELLWKLLCVVGVWGRMGWIPPSRNEGERIPEELLYLGEDEAKIILENRDLKPILEDLNREESSKPNTGKNFNLKANTKNGEHRHKETAG